MNGKLTVKTSDSALARIYLIKLRIEDPQSLIDNSLVFVEKEFELTIVSICTTNEITASNTLEDQIYYLGNPELRVQL